MMTPALHRFTFTTDITSSVGWVGAVLAFLALAVIALALLVIISHLMGASPTHH